MLTTTFVAALIVGRKCSKSAGSCAGRPSAGSRACRWTMAAPAFAAPITASTICSGVTGRCGDIVGVWIEPVTAHVTITLRSGAIGALPRLTGGAWRSPLVRRVRSTCTIIACAASRVVGSDVARVGRPPACLEAVARSQANARRITETTPVGPAWPTGSHRSSTTSSRGCEQQISALPSAGGSTGSGS